MDVGQNKRGCAVQGAKTPEVLALQLKRAQRKREISQEPPRKSVILKAQWETCWLRLICNLSTDKMNRKKKSKMLLSQPMCQPPFYGTAQILCFVPGMFSIAVGYQWCCGLWRGDCLQQRESSKFRSLSVDGFSEQFYQMVIVYRHKLCCFLLFGWE